MKFSAGQKTPKVFKNLESCESYTALKRWDRNHEFYQKIDIQ